MPTNHFHLHFSPFWNYIDLLKFLVLKMVHTDHKMQSYLATLSYEPDVEEIYQILQDLCHFEKERNRLTMLMTFGSNLIIYTIKGKIFQKHEILQF